MTIDRLCLRNFLMFTGCKTDDFSKYQQDMVCESRANGLDEYEIDGPFDSFDEKFIDGINFFIGANATGKTSILKCIYAACEFSNQVDTPNKARKIQNYFSSSRRPVKEISQEENDCVELIRVFGGGKEFHFRLRDGFLGLGEWLELGIKSVFIPTTEMLSHSKGLIAMSLKWDIPFDATQTDILVNAQLPETNEITDRSKEILSMISATIGGEVIYDNDTFYLVKADGLKVEFSMEAQGFRRLGLLWKLIRNGLLERGSVLLWDEPEASINPELMPLLVDMLYKLKSEGVQIFLASHSYLLAKYIDIKKQSEDDVLFISLYKNEAGEIRTARASSYTLLDRNPIETAEEHLFNAVITKSMGG